MEDDALDEHVKSKRQYVYLLREREFILRDKPVYKIGKTTLPPNIRLQKYPKHSEILMLFDVPDCHIAEKMIIEQFGKSFTHEREYGDEYFSGDINAMGTVMFGIYVILKYMVPTELVKEKRDLPDLEIVKLFYKYIVAERPAWYQECEYVSPDVIIFECKKYMETNDISLGATDKQLVADGKLYVYVGNFNTPRTWLWNNIWKMCTVEISDDLPPVLMPFRDLKKIFDFTPPT